MQASTKSPELCFVHFYEVLNSKILTFDQSDSNLDCNRLQLPQTRAKERIT